MMTFLSSLLKVLIAVALSVPGIIYGLLSRLVAWFWRVLAR